MNKVDCEPIQYEDGRFRLLLGDKARARKVCEERNRQIKETDGFLRQGVNRWNIAHAIHEALDCLERRGLQSAPVQMKLEGME